MNEIELDKIDREILENVRKCPGCSIAEAMDSLRKAKSNSALRARVLRLELHGYLRVEHRPRRNTVALFLVEGDHGR